MKYKTSSGLTEEACLATCLSTQEHVTKQSCCKQKLSRTARSLSGLRILPLWHTPAVEASTARGFKLQRPDIAWQSTKILSWNNLPISVRAPAQNSLAKHHTAPADDLAENNQS